jgi:hypothetical protein
MNAARSADSFYVDILLYGQFRYDPVEMHKVGCLDKHNVAGSDHVLDLREGFIYGGEPQNLGIRVYAADTLRDVFSQLSDKYKCINGHLTCGFPDFTVKGCFIFTELTHVAEDRDLSALEVDKSVDRRLNRGRVRVVAVVDDFEPASVYNIRAAADGLVRLNSADNLVVGHSEQIAHSRCRERV